MTLIFRKSSALLLSISLLFALFSCDSTVTDDTGVPAAESTGAPQTSETQDNSQPTTETDAETEDNTPILYYGDLPEASANPVLSLLPRLSTREPSNTVPVGDGAVELVFDKPTESDIAAYIRTLERAGFTLAQSNTVGKNLFYTYTNSEICVSASLTPTNNTMRIIAEPVSNYYVSEKEYTTVTTPLLTMIGREFAAATSTYLGKPANSGLMCFIIRLSDGRFILIDGGTSDNGFASYSTAIYAKLRAQAPDPNNIVIAAWIITHSHGDHIGGFRSFSSTYGKIVTLQSIIYDFPSQEDHDACSDETADYTGFAAALACWPETPTYKAHTGQILNIADAEIRFWFTQEDFVTRASTLASAGNKNWNNSSLAFSVDIAGERIFFLGDSQEYANNHMANCFGSALKSDIVQMAHHGGIGGTEAIYKAIDAEIGLFTTSDELLPVYISKWAYNNTAVNKLNMKEYWNADSRIKTWNLPYHATGSGFVK